MSKKTASVHVSAIKGKLGARSRVEIATDAFAAGLAQTRVRTGRRPTFGTVRREANSESSRRVAFEHLYELSAALVDSSRAR